jgi:NAD-dependent SIR2 family protein deacetylase
LDAAQKVKKLLAQIRQKRSPSKDEQFAQIVLPWINRIDEVLLNGGRIMFLIGAGTSTEWGLPSGEAVKNYLRKITGISSESWFELVNVLRQDSTSLLEFLSWFNAANDSFKDIVDDTSVGHAEVPTSLACLGSGTWFYTFLLKRFHSSLGNCFRYEDRSHKRDILADAMRRTKYRSPEDPTGKKYSIKGHVYLVTTNWDTILEQTSHGIELPTHVISDGHDLDSFRDRETKAPLEFWPNCLLPIYKIHGAPTYWTCPKCSGASRYRRFDPTIRIEGNIICRTHNVKLNPPSFILPTETIDTPNKTVWDVVTAMSKDVDLLVLLGYGGTDKHVLEEIVAPLSSSTVVVKPDTSVSGKLENMVGSSHLLPLTAEDFTHALMDRFVGCANKSLCYHDLVTQF